MSVATSKGEFQITLERVGGTGIMGIWVFEITQGNSRWSVEFIPERLPYARVNMLPQNEVKVPNVVSDYFADFIQKRHTELPVQRLRKPRKTSPEQQINALANLLLNEEVMPDAAGEKEVGDEIIRYFRNPQFILPVKGKEHRYWFRSPKMGRFYVTHCPPT